ncbi:MAG TPA: pantetheine-phosphate adenylyltransferase [Bacteroidales bacterium]|nr:pantetheine-phosphate adenylyltransferase [Bacteroidales bacterium]
MNNINRNAIFPGSFDPFTVGHESVIKRALPLFDKIIIGVGDNIAKSTMFDLNKRIQIINKIFQSEPKIEVKAYSGLTVDFCKKNNCNYILRGLRTSADFEFERAIGQTNKLLNDNIETVFILTLPEHTFISSSIVRDIIKNKGNLQQFIPECISPDELF